MRIHSICYTRYLGNNSDTREPGRNRRSKLFIEFAAKYRQVHITHQYKSRRIPKGRHIFTLIHHAIWTLVAIIISNLNTVRLATSLSKLIHLKKKSSCPPSIKHAGNRRVGFGKNHKWSCIVMNNIRNLGVTTLRESLHFLSCHGTTLTITPIFIRFRAEKFHAKTRLVNATHHLA